jgi:hypothetical protein
MMFLTDDFEKSKSDLELMNECYQLMTSRVSFRVLDELRDIKREISNERIEKRLCKILNPHVDEDGA